MKKVIVSLSVFMAIFTLFMSTSVVVHADTGPKPDMQIEICNLPKSDYIVAYATKYKEYMGPHHSFIPGDTSDKHYGETNFGDVEDLTIVYNNVTLPEGWYLCDISSFYSNSTDLLIKSGYMWPTEFILIIYDKVSNEYYLTEETKTYAFHSYFKYDMNDYKNTSITLEKKIVLEKSYKYGKEILTFMLRLLITLGIELLLALLFKFDKKSFVIIAITNAVTQIGLNIALNLTAYFNGKSVFYIYYYILIELLIVVVEAVVYRLLCKRGKDGTKKWIISYAILANVLSFVIGVILWFLV